MTLWTTELLIVKADGVWEQKLTVVSGVRSDLAETVRR